ncbi:hypothetical protein Rhopal_006579-T1 [Rhodotorula paludigena]|uniref:CFEM domain-containing protein n=1 Tax=Rhodotorula paludigena TaxID=86838 RepID=A0AAV5GW30_9BASI|nr:hypothetical protein Rhopal_006579-T1 [Rhodotorula paludigena]
MRSTLALATLGSLASIVSAQSTPSQCFLSCYSGQLASSSCSGLTDIACLCNDTQFQANVISCLQSSCTAEEIGQGAAFAQTTCQAVGVSINTALPSSTASDAQTSTSDVPSSVSSAVSSVVSSISESLSNAPSETQSSISSVASEVSSSAAAGASSMSGTATGNTGAAGAQPTSGAATFKVGGTLAGAAALVAAIAF